MLTNLMGRILNVYIYQIITLYALNILQFCQWYPNKAGKKREQEETFGGDEAMSMLML